MRWYSWGGGDDRIGEVRGEGRGGDGGDRLRGGRGCDSGGYHQLVPGAAVVVLEADEMLTVMVLLELVVMTIFVKMMVTVKVEVVLVDVIGVEMIAMTMMKTTILTSNTTTVLQFINNIPSTTTKIVVYLLLQMHSDSSQLKIKCGTMSNR